MHENALVLNSWLLLKTSLLKICVLVLGVVNECQPDQTRTEFVKLVIGFGNSQAGSEILTKFSEPETLRSET